MSCTVEAAPLHRKFQVAVIDEAQFLTDEQRGAAWTRAFLGLRVRKQVFERKEESLLRTRFRAEVCVHATSQVRELHLCGEARVQSLARILAAYCKDSVEEVNVLAPFKPVKVRRPPVSRVCWPRARERERERGLLLLRRWFVCRSKRSCGRVGKTLVLGTA